MDGFWPGAPEWAVEVVSSPDSYSVVEEKAIRWLEFGCGLVWVVSPENKVVTIFAGLDSLSILRAKDTLTGDDLIPSFSLL